MLSMFYLAVVAQKLGGRGGNISWDDKNIAGRGGCAHS